MGPSRYVGGPTVGRDAEGRPVVLGTGSLGYTVRPLYT